MGFLGPDRVYCRAELGWIGSWSDARFFSFKNTTSASVFMLAFDEKLYIHERMVLCICAAYYSKMLILI